ncbi:MAG: hypothetical protein A2Y73_05045 [Chloroflexi bacterium RBG_13_56_8]|nr:MAG: hypothetical protein A2Y73_05045 [Chloroflexi bacterium RBG_13_56_8]
MRHSVRFTKLAWAFLFFTLLTLFVMGCLRKPGAPLTEITYRLPTKLTVSAGGELPGTGIRYERMDDEGAYLVIQGMEALKRRGDSVDWKGDLAPGVSADLSLRVIWYTEDELHLVGEATLKVEEIQPQTVSIPTSSPIKYTGAVAYGIAKGATIPGSPITYEGRTEEGAQLNIEGYPYRKMGDSILWEGELRAGVYVRLDMRVLQYDDKGLRVGGLATLWIGS